MTSKVEERLSEKNLVLPNPSPPAAAYVPFVVSGSFVFISGQLPVWNGDLQFIGKLGKDFSLEEGQMAAQMCALNILAQLKAAVGDLDRVKRCVRLGGFVNAGPDYTDHPKVINGASEVMVTAFGDAGKHARAAIGCGSLPLGVAVEVEGLFEL